MIIDSRFICKYRNSNFSLFVHIHGQWHHHQLEIPAQKEPFTKRWRWLDLVPDCLCLCGAARVGLFCIKLFFQFIENFMRKCGFIGTLVVGRFVSHLAWVLLDSIQRTAQHL